MYIFSLLRTLSSLVTSLGGKFPLENIDRISVNRSLTILALRRCRGNVFVPSAERYACSLGAKLGVGALYFTRKNSTNRKGGEQLKISYSKCLLFYFDDQRSQKLASNLR